MELIDRYIQAVTERLPHDIKEDAAKELRANIEDMLPDDPTGDDVRATLEKLGNPSILSSKYGLENRYLIGPAVYDTYISVLKLVVGIAAITFSCLAILAVAAEPARGGFIELIVEVIGAAFDGVLQAFLWVTFVFVVLDRTDVREVNLPFKKGKWSVDDLPPVVHPKSRISSSEPVASMIFTVIVISLLIFRPEYLAWYRRGSDGLMLVAPVFDIARLRGYIPALVALAVVQFGISVYKLVTLRWTQPLAAANALNNLGLSILTCVMLSDNRLFSQALLAQFATVFETPLTRVQTYLDKGLLGFTVVFVLICCIDSVSGLVKSRRL